MINAKRMGKILMVAAALFVGLIGTRGNGADKPLTNPTAEKLGYFLVACFSNERGAAVFNDLKASLPPDAEFGEHAGKKGVLLRNGPVILTPPENQCAEGFHFSFTMTPLWMGNDAKYHPIISFECVTKDGGKCWLSLAKWPTTVTPLYFAVGTPKWKGAISADNPLIWVAGDSHHIAGGLGTNGLFISIDGAPQVHKKIDPASSVVKIERIVLGTVPQDLGELHAQYWISGSAQDYRADFWLRDLYIGNSAPQEASAPYVNPPWRVAPVPNWVVSPDIPMNCAGNLQCYAKNLKGQDVFIVIECPEGIVPGDFMTFPAGSQTAMVLSGSKVVAHEGRNYYRRRYQLPPYILVCPELAKKPWPFYLCLSTDLPYGTETDVWLGIEWEGGAQAPLRIPIRVAKLGPPPVLKRLSVGMSLGRTDLLAQGDYTAFVKRVGLNFLDLWHDDRTPGVCSPGVNPSADEAIARCMDAGILPCLAIHGSTLLRWGVPPEARCKDIDGKPFAGGDGRSRCPSDRGPEYRKDMEYCRNAAARGVGLTHDLECAGFGIRHACFCERCIEKFKNYLKTRHPDMAFVSPREFEREPAKNAKLHEIWREFISAQGSEWMYDYYKAAGEGLQMARNKPRNPLFLIYDEGLWDSAIDLSEAFARPRNSLRFFAGPPLYHGPENTGTVLREYIAKRPKITDVMPYVGYTYDTPVNDMRSQVLEVFGSGAQGILFWAYPHMDGGELCQIVEGLNAVAKVEDILADGRPIPGVKAEPEGANVAVVGGETGPVVLLVSWYKPVMPITVTLPFPVAGDVVDLLTGETVIKLDAPSTVLTFPKIEGGARLYRCERKII